MNSDLLPLISVIIPVYNVEKYIGRCLESVLNQTYKNLEIILIDDGSPDKCPQICDAYAKKDKRIVVIHKKNGGLSDARNKGIDISRGDYITFIDSDDYVNEELIQKLFSAFLLDEKVDISVGNFKKVYNGDENVSKEESFCYYNSHQALVEYLNDITGKWIIACAKLYKKQLLESIRYPLAKKHEDEYTTYKIINKAEKIAETKQVLYYYFQRNDSIMMQENLNSRLDLVEALIQRNKFVKRNNFSDLYKKEALRTFYTLIDCVEKAKNIEVIESRKRIITNYRKWYLINFGILNWKEKIEGIYKIITGKFL